MSSKHATINTNKGYGIVSDVNDFTRIYNSMMHITDGDYEISSDAVSWCKLASVGETYDFREGQIVIAEF